jgi:branched-chain amino acid transport system substrate-binding protein
MLRKVILALLIAAVFGFGAVNAQEDPIKIGLLTDQSGALTIYGIEQENGFTLGLLYATGVDPTEYDSLSDALAAVRIAGRPVELLVRDNGSVPDTAASQARELIEQEGVEILVGAPSSGVMTGIQQITLDYDVLVFATPAASPAITGANFNVNTFRVCRNTFQDFLAYAPYAQSVGATNFVILAVDNDFGRASAAAAGVLAGAGITFLGEPIYAPLETTDFTPYIQRVLSSGADAVLPIWAGDGTVTLFQQLDELGVSDQMTIVAAFNSNDIVALSDPSTIGNVSWIVYHYSFPQNEINDWLVEKHRAIYNNDVPDLFTECAFATAQAIVQALEATDGDTLPEALIPVLEGMVFEGPKGTYAIRPSDHQALVPMYVAQLTNLDDPDQNFYDLLAEVSAFEIIPPCLLPANLQERCALDADFLASVSP